ncbi:glutaminase A [Clostridium sp. MCC353]|nr:glutaminase A [Clostridium sp. MCC353]
MDLQEEMERALRYGRRFLGSAQPASYIPELAGADPSLLGISIITGDNREYGCGDWKHLFTLQSISKVIALILAIEDMGMDGVFDKVGMEPTGDPFNSIIRLEKASRKPYNPMINAGAIVVCSCIKGRSAGERTGRFLEYARKLCGNPSLDFNDAVFKSERTTGDKNRALAYMMKTNGILEGDVEEHLDVYFRLCSLMVNCRDIAFFGAVLAGNGCNPVTGEPYIPNKVLKLVRSLMVTCGMYDASGEFAAKVGLPSKSGVGGGILSVVPNTMGIGVFGPALDEKGNSVGGVKVLEYLSQRMGYSIF